MRGADARRPGVVENARPWLAAEPVHIDQARVLGSKRIDMVAVPFVGDASEEELETRRGALPVQGRGTAIDLERGVGQAVARLRPARPPLGAAVEDCGAVV